MATITSLSFGSVPHVYCRPAGQAVDIDQHVQVPVLKKIDKDVFENAMWRRFL
jgi:hypothetical protein